MKQLLMEALTAQCKGQSSIGNTVLAAGVNHSNFSLPLVLWSTYRSRDLPLKSDAEITANDWEGSEMKLCVNVKYSHHLPWPERHWERLCSNSVMVSEAYLKLSIRKFFIFFPFWWCLETNDKQIFLESIFLSRNVPSSLTGRATCLDIVVKKDFTSGDLGSVWITVFLRMLSKWQKKMIKCNALL